mgnify:FL=1
MLSEFITGCALSSMVLHAMFGCAWHAEHYGLVSVEPLSCESDDRFSDACANGHGVIVRNVAWEGCDVGSGLHDGCVVAGVGGWCDGDCPEQECDQEDCTYLGVRPLVYNGLDAEVADSMVCRVEFSGQSALPRQHGIAADRWCGWCSAGEMRAALQVFRI